MTKPDRPVTFAVPGSKVLGATDVPLDLLNGSALSVREELVRPKYERFNRFVVVSGDGKDLGSALIQMPLGRPSTHTLRRGVAGELSDGRAIKIQRNGPRPLSRLRRVAIEGDGVTWIAEGELCGTHVRDNETRVNVVRTHVNRHTMDVSLDSPELALAFALIAHGIPQSLSLLNANWLP